MNATSIRRAAILAAAVAFLIPGRAPAQVLLKLGNQPYGNDQVQTFFAADGDTTHLSDPAGLPPWGSAGIGPYFSNAITPVPSPPAAPIFGTQLPTSNSFFSGIYTSNFTDGGSPATTGITKIAAGPVGGSTVASANVHAGLKLVEPNNPPGGYAYEQMDFVADFGVAGPLTGGIGGAPSLIVAGTTTGTGSYAEVGGVVDYYWAASNTAFSPAFTGPFTLIGSLNYTYLPTGGPGPFGPVLVPPTGTLSATPSGPGVLELIGDFYVAGDPAEIDVEMTPEPASWVLMAMGLAALGIFARSRRLRTVALV